MSSTLSLALRRRDPAEGSTLHLPPPATSPIVPGEEPSKYHPAPARNEVAIVQPVLVRPLYSIYPETILTKKNINNYIDIKTHAL